MYIYLGKSDHLIDGDTVRMACYQSLKWPDENIAVERTFVIRLLGVDAPEVRGETREAGLAATAFVRGVLYTDGDLAEPVACEVLLEGQRDVYGRWIGSVRVNGQDLAGMLVESGHAVAKDYARHKAALMGIMEPE